MVGCIIEATKHRLLPFTHRKAADGITIKTNVDERIGGSLAQFFVQRPLLNTEQGCALRMFAAGIKAVA